MKDQATLFITNSFEAIVKSYSIHALQTMRMWGLLAVSSIKNHTTHGCWSGNWKAQTSLGVWLCNGLSHSRSYFNNSFVIQDPNRVHTEAYIMEVILAARKSLFTKRQLNMWCSKNMSTVSSWSERASY